MENILEPMLEDLTCAECKLMLRRMVARVKSHWVTVPVCVFALLLSLFLSPPLK